MPHGGRAGEIVANEKNTNFSEIKKNKILFFNLSLTPKQFLQNSELIKFFWIPIEIFFEITEKLRFYEKIYGIIFYVIFRYIKILFSDSPTNTDFKGINFDCYFLNRACVS